VEHYFVQVCDLRVPQLSVHGHDWKSGQARRSSRQKAAAARTNRHSAPTAVLKDAARVLKPLGLSGKVTQDFIQVG